MDYLQWESSLSVEEVFAGAESATFPTLLADGSILFLTSLKAEQSRSVLVHRREGHDRVITPAPFDLQTRVNEYGGKPFWLVKDQIIFANKGDQCLYHQALDEILAEQDSEPQALTHTGNALWMYTDLHAVGNQHYLCIAERENSLDHSANKMALVGIDVTKGRPVVLLDGVDFYSNLVVNAQQTQLAWVQWQHPNMPWDSTALMLADLHSQGDGLAIDNVRSIDLSDISRSSASVCQLLFSDDGDLFFSADFADTDGAQNWWQIYRLDTLVNRPQAVTSADAEYGYPHWVYGDQRIIQADSKHIVAIESRAEGDALVAINLDSNSEVSRLNFQGSLQSLHGDGQGNVVLNALSFVASPKLVNAQLFASTLSDFKVIKTAKIPELEISQAHHIRFNTRDQINAYGFFYPPKNKHWQAQTNAQSKPPLLVMVHGGPTARAYGHFDLQKQFWTSRGFAIFDVNHRGSSGYGRRYRDALYDQWGEIDITDVIDGIEYLAEQNLIDRARVCIRGKSAGGYAVLRALTEYPQHFKAGASYYGIGNLVTLAESTHKFEKHYVDRLIGEAFSVEHAKQRDSRYYQRSPINKVDQLACSMIVFQGLLDKVVPPSVAKELVEALENQNQQYQYVEYADEAHGFKLLSNNIDALTQEYQFYRQTFGFGCSK